MPCNVQLVGQWAELKGVPQQQDSQRPTDCHTCEPMPHDMLAGLQHPLTLPVAFWLLCYLVKPHLTW